jgi:GGDEF domain-containing protein
MSPAATATSAASGQETARRPRRARSPIARRAGIQLIIGVLIVGAIPIASTVRILEANALRNERAQADTALRTQLQSGLRELTRMGDQASNRAADLARSPDVQRAFITPRPAALARIAREERDVSFVLNNHRLGAAPSANVLQRSVWLTVNGRRIGKVVAARPLDQRLSRRLTGDAPHSRGDRLVLVEHSRLLGTSVAFTSHGRTVRLQGTRYRSLATAVEDAGGARLLALRPQEAIDGNVAPYRQRIRYAALGSFALLVLVALMFAGPLLRMLGDFRRVASQAATDSLTGLANRRSFDEELGSGVRQIDLAARYGGEEFVVLVPESDLKGATQLAKRLRLAVSKARTELADGRLLKVTASFGVAVKGDLTTAEGLVAAADEALYEAKRAGKDRVVAGGTVEAAPRAAATPRKKTRATITDDAGLGEGGLRAARGSGARSGAERSAAKGRSDRPGSKDPA